MWSDSSFWVWFAFARWLVMLTKFAGAHWPSVCLPGKNPVCILSPFLSWFVYFCYYVVWVFKNIFWMLASLDIWFEWVTFSFCLFNIISIAMKKLFSLTMSHLFIFAFAALAFSVKSKKKWSRPLSRRYCLCFLLGVLWFQVLCSRVFIHL